MATWTDVPRLLLFVTALGLFTGCKLAVIVVEGGEVQSTMSGTCLEGDNCIIEITGDNFSESFTAVANTGWEFVRWNAGDGFFCDGEATATCALTNVGAGSNPTIAAIIDSDATFYIMPIFQFIGLPITPIMADDGNEWANPILFAGLTYNDIAAACPGGTCSGELNGYNVDGWNWASGSMVADLINAYVPGYCIYPCLFAMAQPIEFFNAFLADGFSITQTATASFIDGYTSDPVGVSYAGIASLVPCSAATGCLAQAGVGQNDSSVFAAGPPEGAWLYR